MTPYQQQPDGYWRRVEQLMHLSWYRAGAGPRGDRDWIAWGFREGHLLDFGSPQILWIAAQDEASAMEWLLTHLQEQAAGSLSAAGSTLA